MADDPEPEPDPGHRLEVDLGSAAGVSDRGLVHRDNEDGMGLAIVPGSVARPGPSGAFIAVVCDGVSTVPGSGPAARAAARAATEVLVDQLTDRLDQAGDVIVEAAAVAQAAVAARADPATGIAPSCTFVAAAVIVTDGGARLTVGSLGDSRVYVLGPGGPARMTDDDTLAAEAARAGFIPTANAETAIGAHTITRWLGADSERVVPRVTSATITGPARVIICSDGLWNYTSDPAELAGHVADLPAAAAAIDVARRLTEVALRAGGRDNITTVVVDVAGAG